MKQAAAEKTNAKTDGGSGGTKQGLALKPPAQFSSAVVPALLPALHNATPQPFKPTVQRALRNKTGAGEGVAGGAFVNLVNQILQGHHTLALGAGKRFTLTAANAAVELTQEATVLLEVLQKIIGDGTETAIDFGGADANIFIGGFDQEKIDVAGAAMFGVNAGDKQGPSAASMLVHELEEQYQKQVNGIQLGVDDEEDAHWDYAIPKEEEAIGGFREGTSMKNYLHPDDDANTDYTQDIKYSYLDGTVVIVTYRVENNAITNVARRSFASETAWEAWGGFNPNMDMEDVTERKITLLEAEREELQAVYDEQYAALHRVKRKQKKTSRKKPIRETIAKLKENKRLLDMFRAKADDGDESEDPDEDDIQQQLAELNGGADADVDGDEGDEDGDEDEDEPVASGDGSGSGSESDT